MVVRDVVTCWNYTHAMIKRALMLRKAIDTWVLDCEEVQPFFLSNNEWSLLEKLAEVLEVCRSVFM
ncbi:hypothetical protein BV22DRAFT_1026370 [Leucogyrophana mollusca]|uniref:Uncharacterized protein n=1 Tax=Leucogyrophana mollusca TaxID=85980 RepID=A0ACB8AW51_9AGAM|nr:hypothetical protein BV22DRAFT_1026370 [Leucogyrophana mollusca]